MTESSKDTDQSMEDILQSIKRIIADEGEPAAAVAGSDVLELTELLAEDAAPPAPNTESTMESELPASQGSQEALDALFSEGSTEMPSNQVSDATQEPVIAMPATPPEPAIKSTQPATSAKAEPAKAEPMSVPANEDGKLISDEALAASIAALNTLPHPHHAPAGHHSAVFRSGTTVEDLVIESLKPMLKEWLDTNLPSMVRSLVEREIRRLSL